MPISYVDLAILGGGCAGLSLAYYLSQTPGWNQQAVILEPRVSYENDRSWCFWEPSDLHLRNELAPLIKHHWGAWRFSAEHFATQQTAAGRRYCYVAAADFYQRAVAAIEANPQIQLWRGYSVLNTASHQNGFLLTLADGSSLIAGRVVDTRPSMAPRNQQALLWQIFSGHEVKTKQPVFDQSAVGLMENLVGNAAATQFVYTLPFSATHALIELTYFSRELMSPVELMPALNHYLDQRLGRGNYTIVRSEQAALPMGLSQVMQSSLSRYHYAGIGAGAIRPATGYAFIRIQKWARAAAKELREGGRIPQANSSSWAVRVMDSIFLRVMHDTPALGAPFFQALAQRVPGPALVRFLMDEATAKDYWYIMKALPTLRFLAYSLGLNRFMYPRQVGV